MATPTDITDELNKEYDRFIEFGTLLDRKMRKYIVQYLQNKFAPDTFILPELSDQYFEYFTKALDDIMDIDGLVDLAKQNHKIRKQLILDIIYWLRQSYDKARSTNPYDDEQLRLEGWAVTPMHAFVKRWPNLPIYINANYRRDQVDSEFYKTKFEELIKDRSIEDISKADQEQIEVLLHDILAQWDALLYAKVLEFQLSKLEQSKDDFIELVENKVEEYNKLKELVSPFSEYFGWDMSRELWQETSFDLIAKYSDMLEDEQSIKELADVLGQMREAEIEIQEETFEKTIVRQEWVIDEHSKVEIVGIHESDNLTNMLSSEAVLLSDTDTESMFLKKYADKHLMTFKYEDRKLVESVDHYMEINQRVKQKEKGPFIICVDTSESMRDRPEIIAKVLCLGILKMTMSEDRKAYLINFAQGINVLDLHDIANSIDQIADFLQKSFYGGTDPTLALHESLKQLGTNDYRDADVLMVSDFIMYKIDSDILQQIKYFQQNKNTQFHSLTLSSEANVEVLETFDTNWVFDPKVKGIIKSMTEGLDSIRDRY